MMVLDPHPYAPLGPLSLIEGSQDLSLVPSSCLDASNQRSHVRVPVSVVFPAVQISPEEAESHAGTASLACSDLDHNANRVAETLSGLIGKRETRTRRRLRQDALHRRAVGERHGVSAFDRRKRGLYRAGARTLLQEIQKSHAASFARGGKA